jgi:hypothetical protein
MPDLTDMDFYWYLVIGGGVAAVIALGAYFIKGNKSYAVKVPAIVVACVGCLGAGVGLGVVLLASYGYEWKPQPSPTSGNRGPMGFGRANRPPFGGGGPRPNAPRMPFGQGNQPPMPFFNRGPDPRIELAVLVLKLDQVTGQPVTLDLTDAQKKAIRKAIKTLLDDEPSRDEATKKLKALCQALNQHKTALEAAGYRWPFKDDELTGQAPADRQNPFNDKMIRRHLKALRERLAEEPKERI